MRQPRRFRRHFPFFPFFFIVALLGIGFAVQFLWNNVLVSILPVNIITYWQAVGLLALCRILFGNFGGPGGRRWGRRPEHPNPFHTEGGGSWRAKWRQMTTEERQKFREEMINRRKNRFNR